MSQSWLILILIPPTQEVECEDHHQLPVPRCGWKRGPQQFVWSGFGTGRQQRGTSPHKNLLTEEQFFFCLILNKNLFSLIFLTRCVQPAARTLTTVQGIWDTWSSLCPCTTRCFSMWAAVCTTHTHTHVPHIFFHIFLLIYHHPLYYLSHVRNSTCCYAAPACRVIC